MTWKTLSLSILQKMRKHALERMPVELGQPFAKEIRHVIYGSNQPSQQKPGIEMSFPGQWLCLMVWISLASQKADKVFETFAPAEILPAWTERDIDEMKWRKTDSKAALWTQRPATVGSPLKTKRTEDRATKDCPRVLKSNGICLQVVRLL